MYILNIVIVCINGASLFNNIMAWGCAGLWVGVALIHYLSIEDADKSNELRSEVMRQIYEAENIWLRAEIDTLKIEKEDLKRTLEEVNEELKGKEE
jgi:hypothetical protein